MRDLIDTPPVWLILFIAAAWAQSRVLPLGLSVEHPVADLLSGLLIGGGLVLILTSALAFRKHRTTIMPHQTPERIIQSGVYARSRNPIYLADALLLLGFILRFDAVLSFVLVPIFVWWIEKRFILPEEDRMRRTFRLEYARYEQKVRRWL
ncbi:MAG: methyltransferase [Pseudomonadota bacterium]